MIETFALAIALVALQDAASPIHLACAGEGIHRRSTSSTGRLSDGTTATVSGTAIEDYADHVRIELAGADGRIRVPAGLMPALRYGGEDGWWPLRDVEYSDNEIRARFSLNFMNNPRIVVDRITGHVSIRGKSGNFSGQCEAYDPATVRRRF